MNLVIFAVLVACVTAGEASSRHKWSCKSGMMKILKTDSPDVLTECTESKYNTGDLQAKCVEDFLKNEGS